MEIPVQFLFDNFKINPKIRTMISSGERIIEKKTKKNHGTSNLRIYMWGLNSLPQFCQIVGVSQKGKLFCPVTICVYWDHIYDYQTKFLLNIVYP